MTFAPRLAHLLALLVLVAASAAAETQSTPATDTGTHAWTNPGKTLPCVFRSGTLTATGLLRAKGCNPNHDTDCKLVLEVVSIKEDSARGFLAHDPTGSRCTITMEDGRKRVLGPLWRKSGEGDKLVRVSGIWTDGLLAVSRFRILGAADGHR